MTCYLKLEDGTGSLLLEDGSGYLLLEKCDEAAVALLGGKAVFGQYPGIQGKWTPDEYEAAFKFRNLESKKDKVIELKLEAQEVVIKKKEFSAADDKQSRRQLRALDRKSEELALQINELMEAIHKIEIAANLKASNDSALTVLQLAYPFLNFGGTMQ